MSALASSTAAPAAGLNQEASLPALVRSSTEWLLRDSLTTGDPTSTFSYGTRPLVPLMGDWDGNGSRTPATFEAGIFKLRDANSAGPPDATFSFGDARGFAVGGDWDGDGTDDIGVYRDGHWEIRFASGSTRSFRFGAGSWPMTVPVTGDWNGDGIDGIGVFDMGTSTWTLRNTATAGPADVAPFGFGSGSAGSSYPVVGDWAGNGSDTVGVKAGTTWALRHANAPGPPDLTFNFGTANDLPLSWRPARPPTAMPDEYVTEQATKLTVAAPGVLHNDLSPGNAPMVAVLVEGPSEGALSLASDGSFVYTPIAAFVGDDSFTYRAEVPGEAASGSTKVTITVAPVATTSTTSTTMPPDPSLAPDTSITATPPPSTMVSEATFTFASTSPGATFECRLDTGSFVPCTNPHTLAGVSAGRHEFAVRSRSLHGAVDPTPATFGWTVVEPPPILPDLSAVASANDPTAATNKAESTAFLYSGPGAPQTAVAPGLIEPQRLAVIRGRVLDRDANPIGGVRVSLVQRPEFGHTFTRGDGWFDLALNGGARVIVDYRMAGYVPLQREVRTEWDEFQVLDDVVLTPYDSRMTVVQPAAAGIQVAAGSVVEDTDGRRQAVVVFPAGTTAEMVLADGTRAPLGAMTVRATELTVGDAGPSAMPGELPARSAYTYAVELSVDEAEAAGATGVEFNQPIAFYTDNFLGAGVGEYVPVGIFDRIIGEWVAQDDGLVIGILAETPDGLAVIDFDGKGVPGEQADYDELGITEAERRTLAERYEPGHTLWRVRLIHFSPCDLNWIGYLAPGFISPLLKVTPDLIADPECVTGSIIECENQALAEEFPIAGTPFSLRYQSNFQEGRRAAYRRLIQISDDRPYPPAAPRAGPTMLRIDARITVAGRTFDRTFAYRPGLTWDFHWDGRDAYGRPVQGPVEYKVEVGYVYQGGVYQAGAIRAGSGGGSRRSFGTSGGPVATFPARNSWEMRVAAEFRGFIGTLDARTSATALGGFNLDIHHAYAPDGRALFEGSGTQRGVDDLESLTSVVESSTYPDQGFVVAEDGTIYFAHSGFIFRRRPGSGYEYMHQERIRTAGDGGPIGEASVYDPRGLAIGPDGALYVATDNRIRRIDLSTEIITTEVEISGAVNVAFGPDGSMYVLSHNSRIDRRGPDGTWSHFAGKGTHKPLEPMGDGGPATEARFTMWGPMIFDRNDNMIVADWGSNRVRMIDRNGIVTTLVGERRNCSFGIQAVDACLGAPSHVALGPRGDLYIAESYGDYRLLRVDESGIIHHVTGGRAFEDNPSPTPAGSAPGQVGIGATGVVVGPDGSVFVGYTCGSIISCSSGLARIAPAFPGYRPEDVALASEDGSQLFRFDSSGRHLQTTDTLTGAVLHRFAYDGEGRLSSVTDVDGLLTTIDRSAPGRVVIRAPKGQETVLRLGPGGFVESLVEPGGATRRFTWDRGLMQTMTTPRNHVYQFGWDGLGRLIEERAPDGLRYVLTRSESAGARRIEVAIRTGLERQTVYAFEALPDDGLRRTVTAPDGTVTTSVTDRDGLTVTELPTGETVRELRGPDPRFGPSTSLPLSLTVETPGGLKSTTSWTRSAVLDNPDDPLSLKTFTETMVTNGRTSRLVYDGASRTVTSTSAAGRVRTTSLDAAGRVIEDARGDLAPTRYAYDTEGRLTSAAQGTGSEERVVRLAYNPQGFVETITDPLDRQMRYAYDPAGRVTAQTLPGDRVVRFDYDAAGNPTTVAPPGRPDHRFGYTEADLGATYTPPDVGDGPTTIANSYDRDRRVSRIDLPTGQSVDIGYNGRGQLAAVNLARGQVGFSYRDVDGQIEGINAPGAIALRYSYDGSLPTAETLSGPVAGEVSVTYDDDFRPATQTTAGHTVAMGYDADNLLSTVGELTLARSPTTGLPTGAGIGELTEAWDYNDFGEPDRYQVQGTGGVVLYELALQRDRLGRITTKTETTEGTTTTWGYDYDPAGRLARVGRDGTEVAAYTYDANGNRLSATTPGGTTAGTYDDQDRLLAYGDATYTYNAIGQLTGKSDSAGATTYAYDEIGNLIGVTLPDGTAIEYLIDGRNRRVGKKVNGALVQGFVWEDQLRIAAETDGDGNVVSRFVYGEGINVPEYMVRNGVTYRIVTDHLGSPRLVVNTTTGEVVQRIEHDAWGNVLDDTNRGLQPFGFAGGLLDRHTTLVRFGARNYDPYGGRWAERDPRLSISNVGESSYQYSSNSPIARADASGKDDYDIVISDSTLRNQHVDYPPVTRYQRPPMTPTQERYLEIQRLDGQILLYKSTEVVAKVVSMSGVRSLIDVAEAVAKEWIGQKSGQPIIVTPLDAVEFIPRLFDEKIARLEHERARLVRESAREVQCKMGPP